MTPAAIEKVVDTAALEVFREATETGRQLELDTEHLLSAIERYGGQDRPTVEHWTWDSLVLARDQGAAAAAPGGDRGSGVGAPLRRRPADRAAPRRPAGHRQDDRCEGARGTGARSFYPSPAPT